MNILSKELYLSICFPSLPIMTVCAANYNRKSQMLSLFVKVGGKSTMCMLSSNRKVDS